MITTQTTETNMARIKKIPPTPCDRLITLRLTSEQLCQLDEVAARESFGNRSKALKHAITLLIKERS